MNLSYQKLHKKAPIK